MPRPAPAIAIADARARETATKETATASELAENQEADEELQMTSDLVESTFLGAEADVQRLRSTLEAIGRAARRSDIAHTEGRDSR